MRNETYKARPIECPRCHARIPVWKRKDGSGIHKARMNALARHMGEIHGTKLRASA